MARGARKSVEDQIQLIDMQIEKWEQRKSEVNLKISDLKSQKQGIQNEIYNQQISNLKDILESTGFTPEQLIEIAKQQCIPKGA